MDMNKELERVKKEYEEARVDYLNAQYQANMAKGQIEATLRQAEDNLNAKAAVVQYVEQQVKKDAEKDLLAQVPTA